MSFRARKLSTLILTRCGEITALNRLRPNICLETEHSIRIRTTGTASHRNANSTCP
ncbi:hypothetical protein PC116_g12684 [Phytophthora cactorum]|nr:hypothetical protein PC116_g12684 [Phytophthora cactorum]